MKQRARLFAAKRPYDLAATDDAFWRAMQENCRYQYAHCPSYRRVLDGMGFSPDDLRSRDDLERLPALPTALFKRHSLFAVPGRRMIVKATSSGTGGKMSRIGFTLSDLWCGLKMVLKVSKLRHLFSPVPCHYILFGYKPHRGNKTAVTKTALGATLFTPALSRTYALTWQNGGYAADLEHILQAVQKRARSRFPVRFMGFPSYTWFLLKMMDERNIRVQLPRGSRILLGGGWKQFFAEQVDKSVFYALAKKVLGVDDGEYPLRRYLRMVDEEVVPLRVRPIRQKNT